MKSYYQLICANEPAKLRKMFGNVDALIQYRDQFIDQHGQTLLMYAIRKRRPECARIVASQFQTMYINEKERANRGSTALHLAAQQRYYPLVCLLVKLGANPLIPDEESHTAISLSGEPRIRSFLSGVWQRNRWSPALHSATPYEFQLEAAAFAGVNWHFRALTKDALHCVMEALLELHRREYRGERALYSTTIAPRSAQAQRLHYANRHQCVGITKKGVRCKANVEHHDVNHCWRHTNLPR